MKKLVLCFSALFSFGAFSAERCNITGHGLLFKSNGKLFKHANVDDVRFVTRENNWKKCYKKAIKMSKDIDAVLPITVSRGGVTLYDGYIHIYLKWSFDDSPIPFMDTSGKITKYTEKYETYPSDGDLRYFSDGRLFE